MEGGGEGEGQRRDHAIVGDSILGTECLNESSVASLCRV